MHEKAAFLYINLKMLPQAMKILEITKPPKILIQLAKVFIEFYFIFNINNY